MTAAAKPTSPAAASGRARAVMRWVLAAFFAAAGIAHLLAPDKLLAMTPSWVPFAAPVIFITGLCELAGAVALVTRPLRWWAGIALAAYALCVWPANFKHALDGIRIAGIPDSWWYHGPRLAAQPLIIWATLYAAGVIDWPWRHKSR
ncbi:MULTISPECIES: DoxX family protein [Rhodopseudomonas]|uniref:Membrane protein n=1 Tax=Rhodopseudomonas palustris TaxID=1076 RepID=A0A0D7EYV0_RHOPL|nr:MULTISPECIES: DoxX family protein [Rhodopseudomonas]KIZ45766.1 membrane protein [Rhodopseudomonas palustris]MDF3813795.1 DoxX family protein [Rhodopseudomonas sp. BAL398]WOK18272.1 DoxX family protein [Rhodopseudomonas sp. BAL398]